MVDKPRELPSGATGDQWATAVRESASQIWLAGLGAFAAAQREGKQMFEGLVKQGEALRERTRKGASDVLDELTAQSAERWDKLGQLQEELLGRALHRLNLPTRKDIDELNRLIDKLAAAAERPSVRRVKGRARMAGGRSGAGPRRRLHG